MPLMRIFDLILLRSLWCHSVCLIQKWPGVTVNMVKGLATEQNRLQYGLGDSSSIGICGYMYF